MKIRLPLVVLVLSSLVAHAEPVATLDAFLRRHDTRPLVDAARLAAPTRALWVRATVTSTEPRLGVPTSLWAAREPKGSRSLRAMGLSPEQAARRYLYAYAPLYRGEPVRWAEAVLTRLHDLHDGGAVIATFQQRLGGVAVFRDEVHVVMTQELELVGLTGYLTPELRRHGSFSLTPESAIATVVADQTGRGFETASLKALAPQNGYERWAVPGTETPVRTSRVYFPLPEGVVPAFYVELDLAGDYRAYVISAADGSILLRHSLTAYEFGLRVWADDAGVPLDGPYGNDTTPHPTGTPQGLSVHVQPPVLYTRNTGPISTADGWLDPGAPRTEGNNAFAYADLSAPNGFSGSDVTALPTSPDTFDRVYDTTLEPDASADQRMAAITQLFFNVNYFHDWYYDKGFTEADGNAQKSNYGRGGKGNDPLKAEAQDYSGRNNANMSTPSDGASPRMQMYIFDGTSSSSLTLNPGGPVTSGTAGFGPTAFNLSGTVVLANDGTGTVTDACEPLTNTVTGQIVLIDRGSCTFASKVLAAQNAGAVGVIIADNVSGTTPPPLGGPGTATIPSLSVTQADGAALKAALQAGSVTATLALVKAPDHDGSLDNLVVAHEWGHYISNRLIGDGNGLSNNQASGMGEGWADFHAMLLTVKASDAQVPSNPNWTGTWGLAGYAAIAADPLGFYYGFRRVPYSTDFAKNALTFKHIADGTRLPSGVPTAFGISGRSNSEVHNTGEVWATMLWECYAALLRDPRYTFEAAQDRMQRYLVAAYKATALMPTFVDARDGVLMAAAASDVTDYGLFWAAFARRGNGMLSVAPDRDSQTNSPVTESYVVGNAINIVDVQLDDSVNSCDHDGALDDGEDGVVAVTVKNVGIGRLDFATLDVTSSSAGIGFPAGTHLSFSGLAPFETRVLKAPVDLRGLTGIGSANFHVEVNAQSLAVPGPVFVEPAFRVNYDVQPMGSATDDVEAPATVWTAMSDPALTSGSDWRVVQSAATAHYWFGPDPASPADTWLISPLLQVGQGPFTMTFRHRYQFEQDTSASYDGGKVEISLDNGATWTDLGPQLSPGYTVTLSAQGSNPIAGQQAYGGESPNYPDFETVTASLGTTYAGQAVMVRFRIGSDDAAAARGWDVDDIAFTGLTNTPFSTVVVNAGSCANTAPTLSVGADQMVDQGLTVTLTATSTDADGDAVKIAWTQVAGPAISLASTSTVTGTTTTSRATFLSPPVTVDTPLVFSVTATDGKLLVGPQSTTVTVSATSHAPVLTVPAGLQLEEGTTQWLLARAEDPTGGTPTFTWTQVDGPELTLLHADQAGVGVEAPLVDGDQHATLQVVAHNPRGDSKPGLVSVRIVDVPGRSANQGCRGCSAGGGFELVGLLGLAALARRRRGR